MLYLAVNHFPGCCKVCDGAEDHPYITQNHVPVVIACLKHDAIFGEGDDNYVPLPEGMDHVLAGHAGYMCGPDCPEIPESTPRQKPNRVEEVCTVTTISPEAVV